MPSPRSVDSFLACLRLSGLLDAERIDALVPELKQQGVDVLAPKAIADALVRDETLTPWQAENLLRGKKRGFLLGKYRLLGMLGRGGMGAVYLAEHSLMRRRCAIKVLPATSRTESSMLERFHQEALALARLDHTNIVRAYDIDKGTDGSAEIHFFVMEFAEGETLLDRVTRLGPLAPVEAADFVRQTADGLAHAHREGILHRDIKPANLLIDRDGVIKILDLGLATFFNDDRPEASGEGDRIFGSADFLPPERAMGGQKIDERSDIYSLGCTFYFLLAGHAPFPAGTLNERLIRHQFEPPASLAKERPDVPDDLNDIVAKMLAKQPADRFQTADEVRETLRTWLVRHADRDWLRKNPAILGSSDPLAKTAQPSPTVAITPATPIAMATLVPSEQMQDDTAAIGQLRFATSNPDEATVLQSGIMHRRGMFKRRDSFLRTLWKDRRGRAFLIVAVAIGIGLLALMSWLYIAYEGVWPPNASRPIVSPNGASGKTAVRKNRSSAPSPPARRPSRESGSE